MTGPENWFCGRAPMTDMERRQAETEAMYAREEEAERRARFAEAPIVTDGPLAVTYGTEGET